MTYGLFRCYECGHKGITWPHELPALDCDEELWPTCSCCGRKGRLVMELVPGGEEALVEA
jgi:hypothetical protein